MNVLLVLLGIVLAAMGVRVTEDSPLWACHHMGNHVCGPVHR